MLQPTAGGVSAPAQSSSGIDRAQVHSESFTLVLMLVLAGVLGMIAVGWPGVAINFLIAAVHIFVLVRFGLLSSVVHGFLRIHLL